MDEAVLIGMNISVYDMKSHIDKYLFMISTNWSLTS